MRAIYFHLPDTHLVLPIALCHKCGILDRIGVMLALASRRGDGDGAHLVSDLHFTLHKRVLGHEMSVFSASRVALEHSRDDGKTLFLCWNGWNFHWN